MKKATTSIILDKRRALKDGTYPVKLRVTYQRKQVYYPVPCSITETYELPANYSFTESDYKKAQSPKPRGMYKDIQTDLQAFEGLAADIVKKLRIFSFEAFEKQLFNSSAGDDVFAAFSKQIDQLRKEERIGTSVSYQCAVNSLMEFSKAKKLSFLSVTPTFLKEYERWMEKNGKSLTTVGIYLRPLRAIFNEAIAAGDLQQEHYPFGRRKYLIPAGRNEKKALDISDIGKIYNYQAVSDKEAMARDLWYFSYLCNGINIKDMALLRYSDISDDRIVYIRAKTKNTSRQNLRPVVVMLCPDKRDILERWGTKPKAPTEYVFPWLTKGLSPEKERARIQEATKQINKHIKRIAEAVGIKQHVTTYTARHSFATVLKYGGIHAPEISEAIGHKDLKTTEHYLADLKDEARLRYSDILTAFKEEPRNIEGKNEE